MTVLLAVNPETADKHIARAAAAIAHTLGERLHIGAVLPRPTAGDRLEHREYQAYLQERAEAAIARAAAELPEALLEGSTIHLAHSIPTGILELAQAVGARVIVVGSALDGMLGRVTLGSTTDRLVHSSPVTLCLVPRGVRVAPDTGIARVTVAHAGERDDLMVLGVARLAGRLHAQVRVARFWVQRTLALQQRLNVGPGSERESDWAGEVVESLEPLVQQVTDVHPAPTDAVVVAARGETWDEAIGELDWAPSDVLVVGSSGGGALGQVFLGSKATKIVRSSPVPVFVVPAQRAQALAGEPGEVAVTG